MPFMLQLLIWKVAVSLIVPFTINSAFSAIIPEGRHCGHTVKKLHEEFYDVELEPHHVIKKRSVFQPLRIHIHFDKSVTDLPYEYREILKKHVRSAVHFWESTLRVRASEKPIRLRRKCNIRILSNTKTVSFSSGKAYCIDGCAEKTECGDITVPDEHLDSCAFYNGTNQRYYNAPPSSPGVDNTDFILYVATIHSQKCMEGQTIAYAAHCQLEKGLDRPVAGYFSICPDSISTARESQEELLSTIMHEILHPLGFTAGLFAFYRDDRGNPLTERNAVSGRPLHYNERLGMYTWSHRVARQVERPDWLLKTGPTSKTVHLIVTPRVKKKVRQHFNCFSLEGAELEDQGIVGTIFTHWEKRVFENEAMTGIYTHNSIFSSITLAMMEDTGWYRADYSKAGDYEWGRNLGCDFVKNSCFHWIHSHLSRGESIHPFCDQVKRGEIWTDCTYNRKSVALCNLVEYQSNLEPEYQYFNYLPGVDTKDLGRYGGSVLLADFCPFLQEFTWTDKNKEPVRGSNCLKQHNNKNTENNYFGERYGPSSRCFRHADVWSLYRCRVRHNPQHAGSGCYEYSCIEGQGLVIHVHNQSYVCNYAGQVLEVMFLSSSYVHMGTIKCPPCQDMCEQSQGFTCPPDRKIPQKQGPSYTPGLDDAFCGASRSSSISQSFFAVISFCIFWIVACMCL